MSNSTPPAAGPPCARRWLAGALAALCLLLFAAAAAAQQPPKFAEWERLNDVARQVIESGDASHRALDTVRAGLESRRDEARQISREVAAEVDRIEAELAALGPPPDEGESEQTLAAGLRAELGAQLTEARATLGWARLATQRAETLLRDLARLGQRRFVASLLDRGPSPLSIDTWAITGRELGRLGGRIWREVRPAFVSEVGRQRLFQQAPLALLALAASALVLFGLRRAALNALLRRVTHDASRRRLFLIAIFATVVRVVSATLAVGLVLFAINATGALGIVGVATLKGLALGGVSLILAYSIASAYFSPLSARLRLSSLDDAAAWSAFLYTIGLGLLAVVARVHYEVSSTVDIADEAYGATLFVIVTCGGVLLWGLSNYSLTGKPEQGDDPSLAQEAVKALRRAVRVVAVVSPLLALLGYAFAAHFLMYPTLRSLAVIAIGYLIFRAISDAVDIYTAARAASQRLQLIPVFVAFLLICATLPILALIWGASTADLMDAYAAVVDGVTIGEVRIAPIDFVVFALIFVVGYTVTRLMQRALSVVVLPKTSMSDGAANAMVAGVGYTGVTLAALAAISATSLDLSNIAIVFGALSVGIGFGLQNIVSNFISGVILLIERPINVGDWIEVGGNFGHVRKVNVRSTEIETFDRSSYIIPNSDLISNPVLNRTLGNKMGRVRLSVGVAYASDVRKVEKILTEVAKDHPMVASNPAPRALFLNFGSDSLEFEVFAYLRDVNWIYSVKSDLNFRIVERFREEGVEIPFPQRDLHIKNPEALARAFRGAAPAADRPEREDPPS